MEKGKTMHSSVCRWGLLLVPVGILMGLGCLGPLDTMGYEETVTNNKEYLKEDRLEDDRIEDKNPIYESDLHVYEEFDGCTIGLNKSGSVAKLDILPFEGEDKDLNGRIFSGRGEAIAELSGDLIPSMEVVNGKLKPFNDGFYAAVEMGLQDGVDGLLQSKRQFLFDLLGAVDTKLGEATAGQAAHLQEAQEFIAAGLMIGGNGGNLPADLKTRAQDWVDCFMAIDEFSKPVGFYTWNALLEEVFRQDRFLQHQDMDYPDRDFGLFAALAVVLEGDAELLERYQQILALYSGLTNPYASYSPVDLLPYVDGLASLDDVEAVRAAFNTEHPDLMTCTRARLALLPSSSSKDTEFFNSNWCLTGIPPEVSFIDAFIDAIRSGDVDLAPDPDSGWYDYQLWALETLLLPERGPESDHLLLTAAYKQKLIDTFKSIITQTRETHVKQLQSGQAGGVSAPPKEIEIYPLFPAEPFPTFYLRTARGYRFLDLYLTGVLGSGFMGSTGRLYETGERSGESLSAEIAATTELMYGLYLFSCDSVGLRPESFLLEDELADIDLESCKTRARSWLGTWKGDADVLKDPRVIVPVAVDLVTDESIYWAVLGVKAIRVYSEFVEGYEPEVVSEGHCIVKNIVLHDYVMLVEHMEEVRLSGPPPTREEFRAVCDLYDNAEDIVSALEDG